MRFLNHFSKLPITKFTITLDYYFQVDCFQVNYYRKANPGHRRILSIPWSRDQLMDPVCSILTSFINLKAATWCVYDQHIIQLQLHSKQYYRSPMAY